MIGLLAPAALALVIGLALRRSLVGFGARPIRWWPLAVVALGVQIPLYTPPFNAWPAVVEVGVAGTIVTTGLVLAMLLRNAVAPLQGSCLVASLGVALNLAVMIANGGWMPRADELAPRDLPRFASDESVSNTAPMTSETHLPWLGDTIAQPAWIPLANLVSPGDVLLSAGAAWWAFGLTRRRAPVGTGSRGG